MPRDRISEILEVKARREFRPSSLAHEIGELERAWNEGGGLISQFPEFLPIRLVTFLEVFTKNWVADLIDEGEPYAERSRKLFTINGLKIDFDSAKAISGQAVSLGELISHAVKVNNISSISSAFNALLDNNIFNVISDITDRYEVEVLGEEGSPIIDDIELTKSHISKLFECRHIITHELPDKLPFEAADVNAWIQSVGGFIAATDEFLNSKLYGAYPLTQLQMNFDAQARADKAEKLLDDIIAIADPDKDNFDLQEAQESWKIYMKKECEYRSEINQPFHGSIAPSIYHSERLILIEERIEKLNDWLKYQENL